MAPGGKRNGAGRPKNSGKFAEDTKPIRVPVKFAEWTEHLDDESARQAFTHIPSLWNRHIEEVQRFKPLAERDILPDDQLPKSYTNAIAATIGRTSTLENSFQAEPIDLHHLLVRNPNESFTVPVVGDSMNQAGIQEGDLLVVQEISDLSSPQSIDGSIVVAFVDGNETVKRFQLRGNGWFLVPESDNPQHQVLELTEEMNVQIKGIVLHSIHPTHRSSRF